MIEGSHHRRKGHARNTAGGDVVPVRETRVKNRGRSASAETRNTSRRDGLLGIAENADDIDADDVVFALEHPEWSSQGFRRADAAPWVDKGIDPENAAAWRDAGYDVNFAAQWSAPHIQHAPQFPAEVALRFIAEGIDQFEARFWVGGQFTLDEGVAWAKTKSHPSEARIWHSMGATHPDDTIPYRQLGFDDPTEVLLAQNMKHAIAHEWLAAGVPLKEARRFNLLIDIGYPIQRLAAIVANPRTGKNEEKTKWIQSGVPVEQITEFIEKGYSPSTARTQFTKGVTADQALDKRAGEPVPGKVWKGLKEAFAEKAKAANQTVTVTSEDVVRSRKMVTVTLTDNNDPTRISTYDIFFSYTGKFLEGHSDVSGKRRALSSAAAYRRLHFDD